MCFPSVQAARLNSSVGEAMVSDGSMSFHHPQGWPVSEVGGTILANGPDGEQLCLCALPYYQGWGPEQHARFMVAALQAQNPGLQVTGWKTDPAGDAVFLDLAYSGEGFNYVGTGLVIADALAEQAVWFHYLCAESKYSESRAEQVFKGFVTSLAEGASSQPPGRLARNADAFAFVVGFALGSPLSMAEEEVVLAELERYWSGRSESELAVYDEYHEIVSICEIGDRQQLADVQRSCWATRSGSGSWERPNDQWCRSFAVHAGPDGCLLRSACDDRSGCHGLRRLTLTRGCWRRIHGAGRYRSR